MDRIRTWRPRPKSIAGAIFDSFTVLALMIFTGSAYTAYISSSKQMICGRATEARGMECRYLVGSRVRGGVKAVAAVTCEGNRIN